jgi:hypothetical protein
MRVAETLEAEREAAERERWEGVYREAQQRVVRYREVRALFFFFSKKMSLC